MTKLVFRSLYTNARPKAREATRNVVNWKILWKIHACTRGNIEDAVLRIVQRWVVDQVYWEFKH